MADTETYSTYNSTHGDTERTALCNQRVHEAHLRDERTGKVHIKRTGIDKPEIQAILHTLGSELPH